MFRHIQMQNFRETILCYYTGAVSRWIIHAWFRYIQLLKPTSISALLFIKPAGKAALPKLSLTALTEKYVSSAQVFSKICSSCNTNLLLVHQIIFITAIGTNLHAICFLTSFIFPQFFVSSVRTLQTPLTTPGQISCRFVPVEPAGHNETKTDTNQAKT